MQVQKQWRERMVQSVSVIDIDPALTLFRPNQQKWITSLELLHEPPKQQRNNVKHLQITPGIHLIAHFCQKNRQPIYEIDFLSHPPPEWIPLKMPPNLPQRLTNLTLCYTTNPTIMLEPLTDLQCLFTERKRMSDDKQVLTLPAGYKIVNNNPIPHNYLIYKRMKSLFEQTFKPILLETYPEHNHHINHSMLPIFCFPEGIRLSKELKGFITFNFVLTQENGDRVYATCLSFKEEMSTNLTAKLNLEGPQQIYYEKAICLLSRWRYTDQFSQCLKHLYRLSMSKNDMPFHRVMTNFVDSLLLPKQMGINGISYSYGGSNINFQTNLTYPIISERAIYSTFKFLPLQAIINVFEAILLEKQIIFVSQSKTILGYAIQAFLSFVFPFKWEHVLIPILPTTLKEYLAAPVPFVVGITPDMLDSNIESDSIIIELDNGTVHNDEDLPPLPDKLQKQLRKRLQHFQIYDQEDVQEYLENPESTYIFKMQQVEHPEFEGHFIRDSFYEFLLTLMKNYRKFWKPNKYREMKENSSMSLTEPQLLNDIFRVQDFLSDLGMSKVGSFGYKFTEGTIFTAFIQRHTHISDDPELLFFEQSLDKKKGKKEAKLIQKIANIRYLVASHPEPETVKGAYSYEKFPSILGRQIIEESAIQVEVNEEIFCGEELEYLQFFLEQEWKHNHNMFAESSAQDIDYRIESLLLKTFRKEYQHFCQTLEEEKLNKSNIYHSSLPFKNNKTYFQKLKTFERLYLEQTNMIQDVFTNWPKIQLEKDVVFLNRRQYWKSLRNEKMLNENTLYCVFDQTLGDTDHNFTCLLQGMTKIELLQGPQTSANLSQMAISSKKRLRLNYEVYIQHSKIKTFLNKIIPTHHFSLFQFMTKKIQQHHESKWTLETLIEWRDYLEGKVKV